MKCNIFQWSLIILLIVKPLVSVSLEQSSKQIIKTDLIVSCDIDLDCKTRYFCNDKKICEHKSIYPFDFIEFEVLLIMSLTYGISTMCGMGGGVIASGALMWLENFSTSEAIPISMGGMLVTMTYTFYLGIKFKEDHPTQDFADLKAASIIIPIMLVGSKIGTIVNFTFPFALLTILMMGLNLNVINGTWSRIKDLLQREKSLSQNMVTSTSDFNDLTQKLTPESLYNKGFFSAKESKEKKDFDTASLASLNQLKLKKYLEEENKPLPIYWVKILLKTLGIYITDLFIEGSSSVPSILGVGLCSPLYYFVFGLSMILFFYLSNLHRGYIKQGYDYKRSLDPNYSNRTEEILAEGDKKFMFLCLCAGIFSGAFGVGGGLFLTPYMVEAGFSPKTTTSTSMMIVVFTSFSSTLMFSMIGSIRWDYAFLVCLPSLISCYIISNLLNNYIRRTGKQSILMFLLIGILSISFVLLIFSIYNRISYNIKNEINSFSFNSYCVRT